MPTELFYVFAGILVVFVLAISVIGIRKPDFPPASVLKGGLAIGAVLVALTAYFGVELAAEEKAHRFGHENEQAAEESQQSNIENQENEAGGTLPGEGDDATGGSEDGASTSSEEH